jgi:predicted small lipoprotein YifL
MVMKFTYIGLVMMLGLSACTQSPPTPAEKKAADEQAKKSSKDDYSQRHTGW